jgi:hypothetical protein
VLEGPGRPGRSLRQLADGSLAVVGSTGELGIWRLPFDRGATEVLERELACLAPGAPGRPECEP